MSEDDKPKIERREADREWLDSLDKRIIEASAKYGNDTELFLKDFPQFDRRIDRSYRPEIEAREELRRKPLNEEDERSHQEWLARNKPVTE